MKQRVKCRRGDDITKAQGTDEKEPSTHCAEWKKIDTKGLILYDSII